MRPSVSSPLVLAVVGLLNACDSPVFLESTDRACAYGMDDIDDGLIDCQDPQCSATSVCSGSSLEPCDPDASAPLCADGFICLTDLLVCTPACQTYRDCPQNSICFDASEPFFCSVPCHPIVRTCGEEERCVANHTFGTRFDDGGATFGCYVDGPLVQRGRAQLGDICVDGFTDDGSEVCSAGLACVPDALGNARCREVCLVTVEGVVLNECTNGGQCEPAYPLDNRPNLDDGVSAIGVCL